jgi:hypothetical protein
MVLRRLAAVEYAVVAYDAHVPHPSSFRQLDGFANAPASAFVFQAIIKIRSPGVRTAS